MLWAQPPNISGIDTSAGVTLDRNSMFYSFVRKFFSARPDKISKDSIERDISKQSIEPFNPYKNVDCSPLIKRKIKEGEIRPEDGSARALTTSVARWALHHISDKTEQRNLALTVFFTLIDEIDENNLELLYPKFIGEQEESIADNESKTIYEPALVLFLKIKYIEFLLEGEISEIISNEELIAKLIKSTKEDFASSSIREYWDNSRILKEIDPGQEQHRQHFEDLTSNFVTHLLLNHQELRLLHNARHPELAVSEQQNCLAKHESQPKLRQI